MILSDITILASTILFFAVTIILVVVLLIAKKYLVPSGNVEITINDKTDVEVPTGDSLLSTLANQKIYLQHVAEVAAADNAVYAFPKEEAKLCLLRKCIFPARN